MIKFLTFLPLLLLSGLLSAQKASLEGLVTGTKGQPYSGAQVSLGTVKLTTITSPDGSFKFENLSPGKYNLVVFYPGLSTYNSNISLEAELKKITIVLDSVKLDLKGITITGEKEGDLGVGRLNSVDGVSIYAGKKTEVIRMEHVTGNLSTNNAREVYSRVTGLNIWESDRAGLQLGIGGRGLNPNRVSNFNTRQNGYDISADALGYPESYYTPPTEALDRIEIVRGAASLQYGSQFGGFINFKLKEPSNKLIAVESRQTYGSWKLFNSFNSISGTHKSLSWYGFFQHKQGEGWRPNSGFNNNTGFLSVHLKLSPKLILKGEYTGMGYLAQQPGGLTDAAFEQDPRQSIRARNWFKVNWNLYAISAELKVSPMLSFDTRSFYLDASREALGILGFINRADPLTERDLLVDRYNNYGNETRMLLRYLMKGKPNVLLIGGRYYKGHTDRKQGLASDGYDADFRFLNKDNLEHSEYVFPSENIALFSEHIFQLSRFFSVTPGVRYENIYTSSAGYYKEEYRDLAGNIIFSNKVNDERENHRSFFLYGVGLSFKPNPEREYYANFSRNYRSISFNDMRIVNPNFRVDPDLHDEQGYTMDLGLRGKSSDKIVYEITAFYLRYEDRIGSILQVDPLLYNLYRLRTNISDSRNLGVEGMVEADLLKYLKKKSKNSLSLFTNVSLINAKYINSNETAVQNKKVEFVPDLMFRTGAGWKSGNLKLTLQWGYTSLQYTDATNAEFTANAVNGIIPAYNVADFSASYSYKKVQFLAGINNLFNKKYFTRRADGYPGPGIIPSDGISFYGTIVFRFSADTKKDAGVVKD